MSGSARLIRGVDLRGATAINVISMIGIGPLITIPLVLGFLHGPLSIAGWLIGAGLALCDGLVWAELGAMYPSSGGTYGYLREIFGRNTLGRFLAFLFVWQIIFAAPMLQASGYIGFAHYAAYLFPQLATAEWEMKTLAVLVGIVTLFSLYRGIGAVSRASIWLGVVALVTLLCVIGASYAHFSAVQAFSIPVRDSFWDGIRAGLGQALIITMYDYLGYSQSSCIGEEIRDPAKTIPRSIIISIGLVALLYVSMQIGILGAIPWPSIIPDATGNLPAIGNYVASVVVEHAFGAVAAGIVTVLILITAFASVYGNLLGYSRIPYAAAVDGVFLRAFAHVHGKHRFPDVSLVAIGLLSLPACLLSLQDAINALTTGLIIIQSIAQIAGLFFMRARGVQSPYCMWLFPLPAVLALVAWVYLFLNAGTPAMLFGFVSLVCGAGVFLLRARLRREWPF